MRNDTPWIFYVLHEIGVRTRRDYSIFRSPRVEQRAWEHQNGVHGEDFMFEMHISAKNSISDFRGLDDSIQTMFNSLQVTFSSC